MEKMKKLTDEGKITDAKQNIDVVAENGEEIVTMG